MSQPLRLLRWPIAWCLIGVATGCASVSPVGFVRSIGRSVAGAPEIAGQRDAALAVVSQYYGEDPAPLDLASVLASARHAARVYRSAEQIQAELSGAARIVPLLTAISGLQYYVTDEPDRQVVAIRGTQPTELRNWVANAVVLGARDETLGVDVHEGFLLATRIIEVGLVARLDRNRPVHLTGHSLGGSLATLLALRLERRGYRVSVTTFGAPKLTTFAAFASEPELHRLALVRIVNAGDVVPHFPTMMDTTGKRVYAQFGREWVLTDDGECVETNLAGSLTKSAAFVLDRHLPDWSLAEHGMGTYLDRLTALVDRPSGGVARAQPPASARSARSRAASAASPRASWKSAAQVRQSRR
jgi:triacylglycerol lipase